MGENWKVTLLLDNFGKIAEEKKQKGEVVEQEEQEHAQKVNDLELLISKYPIQLVVTSSTPYFQRTLLLYNKSIATFQTQYLNGIAQKEAVELVNLGFSDKEFSYKIRGELFALLGKHPYLLQGVLGKLWEYKTKKEITIQFVQETAQEFVQEVQIFETWSSALFEIQGKLTTIDLVYGFLTIKKEEFLDLAALEEATTHPRRDIELSLKRWPRNFNL